MTNITIEELRKQAEELKLKSIQKHEEQNQRKRRLEEEIKDLSRRLDWAGMSPDEKRQELQKIEDNRLYKVRQDYISQLREEEAQGEEAAASNKKVDSDDMKVDSDDMEVDSDDMEVDSEESFEGGKRNKKKRRKKSTKKKHRKKSTKKKRRKKSTKKKRRKKSTKKK